jgi:pSer/pThr/pTyr-binding forkhead associated (FHA) protein
MSWFRNRSRGSASDPPTLQGGDRLAVVVLEGADTGASFVVSPPGVDIGRGDETLATPKRLSLRDRSVSALQARLRHSRDGWTLEHGVAATNPTLLNGEIVARKHVAPGDRIRMGRIMLELRSPNALATARPPATSEPEAHTEMIRLDAVEATQLRQAEGPWGFLVVVLGPGRLAGSRFPLLAGSITLGRAQDCDLVLLDPGVSRRHAEIVREGDEVVLIHRSETNPTLRNGTRVGGRTAIEHGDEIALADAVVVRFELAVGTAAATQAGGALRKVMEARVHLEQRIEREFVRNGTFLDVDIADSYGLKSSETRAERVFVSFERFRTYLDKGIVSNSGRVLNSNGDEIMAFFDYAEHALACARSLLLGMREWNTRENLLEREFRVRIGIHTGRSAVDLASGVAYSPVLDVAGHLQKNAPIGGVLISATTHAELGSAAAGLEPGTPLARENMATWVLSPERLAQG